VPALHVSSVGVGLGLDAGVGLGGGVCVSPSKKCVLLNNARQTKNPTIRKRVKMKRLRNNFLFLKTLFSIYIYYMVIFIY
jgi:hypothetical protein